MSLITVGISDLAVSEAPDVIVTYALGSCVGICIYDSYKKIGGMSHIMLPDSRDAIMQNKSEKKYADTSIVLLINELKKRGADVRILTAKIAGGAEMFKSTNQLSIGKRNVQTVKEILAQYNIKIIGEQTGGKIGRTIFFDLTTGDLTVRSAMRQDIII